MAFRIEHATIDGLLVIHPKKYRDERGFFQEIFRLNDLPEVPPLVQFNHAHSSQNVLRGLHFEPWGKLIYVVNGDVLTALADVRPESPTFGKTATFKLASDHTLLYVPEGVAHGYYTLSAEANYMYYCTDYYRTTTPKRAVAWNDPDLAISWPVKEPILSKDDTSNPTLRQLFPDRFT